MTYWVALIGMALNMITEIIVELLSLYEYYDSFSRTSFNILFSLLEKGTINVNVYDIESAYKYVDTDGCYWLFNNCKNKK